MLAMITQRITAIYHKISDLVYDCFHKRPEVLSLTETVTRIIDTKCSVSRIGDGEVLLILGHDLNFQTYDPRLSEKLKQCMERKNDQNNLLVCIPDFFGDLSIYNDTTKHFWKYERMYHRKIWYNLLDRHHQYGNAFISRFYTPYKDTTHISSYLTLLSGIWKDRDIIIVEGEFSRLGVGNDLFNNCRSLHRLIIPSKNAFSVYEEILKEIIGLGSHYLFLMAAGPTATVLASDLAARNYQAIDIGHIDLEYEWWKSRTDKKVPIRGKFCNESYINSLSDGEVSGSLTDLEYHKYKKEIIVDLSKVK